MLARCVAGWCLLVACWGVVRAEATDDGVIHTERTDFAIPFEVDTSLPAEQRPQAIELFVSSDQGQSWRLYEQATASQGSFRFHAPASGEYWFVTRPVTAGGQLASLASTEPELRVRVELPAPQTTLASATMPLAEVPPGAALRMINTTVFDLDYDVPNLSRSATDSVELWHTADGGRTWELHDRDVDRRSPMRVRVPSEGLHGFSLVIVAADGSSGAPPLANDLPQFWVGVDRTQPVGRLTMASTQTNAAGQVELTVRWEADDARLAAEPIAIYYSDSPEGPWSPLALSLVNTGEYTRALPDDMPGTAYLRLEARDEAGNVCDARASDPIVLSTPSIAGSAEIATASRLYHVFH